VYFTTAIPNYGSIVDVGFNVGVVKYFPGVDVDEMLQLREEKYVFRNCFAYATQLGLPSKFVVDNETE
jgi:hypothetical protein